jgi:hypothetical protein
MRSLLRIPFIGRNGRGLETFSDLLEPFRKALRGGELRRGPGVAGAFRELSRSAVEGTMVAVSRRREPTP